MARRAASAAIVIGLGLGLVFLTRRTGLRVLTQSHGGAAFAELPLRRGDVVLVFSGSFAALDVAAVNAEAEAIRGAHPEAEVWLWTSGLGHMAQAGELAPAITGVVYDYEPNYPFEPEFTWDFPQTLANVEDAVASARSAGKRAVIAPTGRPILENGLLGYAWDYGQIAARADFTLVQTQTWCRQDRFPLAIDRLSAQMRAAGTGKWGFQVTVDPIATNGVSAEKAIACAQYGVAKGGVGSVLAWWSPAYPAEAREFLAGMGR